MFYKIRKKTSAIFEIPNPTVYDGTIYTENSISEDEGKNQLYILRKENEPEKCVYIGQTDNLNERLRWHRKDKRKRWDSFVSFTIPDYIQRRQLEAICIWEYLPKYNWEWRYLF